MFQRPMKTYLRNPPKAIKTYLKKPVKPISIISSVSLFSGTENNDNSQIQDESLDDTFDRLRKTAKPVRPVVQPQENNSVVFYSSTSDSDTSELETIPIPQPQSRAPPKGGRKRKISASVMKGNGNLQNPSKTKVSRRDRRGNDGGISDSNRHNLTQQKGKKREDRGRKRKKTSSSKAREISLSKDKGDEAVGKQHNKKEEKCASFRDSITKSSTISPSITNKLHTSLPQDKLPEIDTEPVQEELNPSNPPEKHSPAIGATEKSLDESSLEVVEKTEVIQTRRWKKTVSNRLNQSLDSPRVHLRHNQPEEGFLQQESQSKKLSVRRGLSSRNTMEEGRDDNAEVFHNDLEILKMKKKRREPRIKKTVLSLNVQQELLDGDENNQVRAGNEKRGETNDESSRKIIKWAGSTASPSKRTNKLIEQSTRQDSSSDIKAECLEVDKNSSTLHFSFLPSPNTANLDCWVNLHRLNLRDKLRENFSQDEINSLNSQSEPISVLVSISPEDEELMNGLHRKDPQDDMPEPGNSKTQNSSLEKSEEKFLTRSSSFADESLQSSSLFSTDPSLQNGCHENLQVRNPPDDQTQVSLMKKTEIIERRTSRRAGSVNSANTILDNCSVVLQRCETLGVPKNSNLNQTLWSSTPLVSRIKQKGSRLYLSPIPIPSSFSNQRSNQSTLNDTSQKERNNGKENIEAKLPQRLPSIPIIDEDTEENINASNSSEIILTKIIDDSLKQKIEKQLFCSMETTEDSIRGAKRCEPNDVRESQGKPRRTSNSPRKTEGYSSIITNSSAETSSRLSDKQKHLKALEGKTLDTSSSGTMSPLMFEDSDEEGKEEMSGEDCDHGISTAEEVDGKNKIQILGGDLSSRLSSVGSIELEDEAEDVEKTEDKLYEAPCNEDEEKKVIDAALSMAKIQLIDVLLERLSNPVRVTDRRNRDRKSARLQKLRADVSSPLDSISSDKGEDTNFDEVGADMSSRLSSVASIKLEDDEQENMETTVDKSYISSSEDEEKEVIDAALRERALTMAKTQLPDVLLERLTNSVRVTDRHNRYSNREDMGVQGLQTDISSRLSSIASIKSQDYEEENVKTTVEKSPHESSEADRQKDEKGVIDDPLMMAKMQLPDVLLKRLSNPVRVTDRRSRYRSREDTKRLGTGVSTRLSSFSSAKREEIKTNELRTGRTCRFPSVLSINAREDEEENVKTTTETSPDVSCDENEEKNGNEKASDTTLNDRRLMVAKVHLPDVLLTRLSDPVRITDRRNRCRNDEYRLSAISENDNERMSAMSEEEKSTSIEDNEDNEEDVVENDDEASGDVKSVFLKPGKSWARSLSILNHIQKEGDIEAFAAGKGQKWRQSVISVLNMQNQGEIQSCISSNENDRAYPRASCVSRRTTENAVRKWSSTNRLTSQPSSPGRFMCRMSIRVVPDHRNSKRHDKIQNSAFHEAYGITTSSDRRTLVQTSIPSVRKSSYNLRNSGSDSPIPQPLTVARNVVLDRCNQTDSCPFSLVYPEDYLKDCRKIGEGVYGEVFLFDNGKEKSVIKIIPIEGCELVNGEPQKKFDEILSEIIIAKELHDLRTNGAYRTDGFVEVKNIRCLKGKYPDKLVELWETYDEEKKSDNDSPGMFKDEQLYIALELGDGGKDLEAFTFQNASEAYSSFIQTALTLAVAERSLDFEHRDLHWGNILVSRTNEKEINYKLNSETITLPCQGVRVSIIDFTLSRMSYEGCCIFNDLALDPSLFTAHGEYQFEIYRLMREQVDNNWQAFEPFTNVLWLHYTLDKMITAVRYKRKGTKIHNNYIQRLQELKKAIMDYESAFDFVTNCKGVREIFKIN